MDCKEKELVVENAVGEPFIHLFIHSKKIEYCNIVNAPAAALKESSVASLVDTFARFPRITKWKRENALPSGCQSFVSLLPILQ